MIFTTALTLSLMAGFQQTEWGMSPIQVIHAQNIAQSNREWDAETQTLYVSDTVADFESALLYEFIDSHLYKITVIFQRTHSNKNLFIDDYARMGEKLQKVYGEKNIDVDWKNSLYHKTPEHYGMAIAVGHLTLRKTWHRGDTMINHVLAGDNMEITHGIVYTSKKFLLRKKSKEDVQLKEEL